ncbi:MAG: hypothetical protein JW910_09385 [Anaerolineae bacterium]|nr:hypothetical protein [Anaerolineae bacterium]
MNVNVEIVTLIAGILVILIGFAVMQFRKVRREQVAAYVREHSPADLQGVLVWASMRAYDAVEQLSEAYEALTPDQKQKLAVKFINALIRMATTGQVSAEAATAMLESQIYAGKQATRAVEAVTKWGELTAPEAESVGGAVK